LFPPETLGQRVPSRTSDGKPSTKHSLTTTSLPLRYEMFPGERNPKFYTSLPGRTSPQLLVPLREEWAQAPAAPDALRGRSRLLVIQ